MHEHLRNLSLSWVAFGWFIAVAIVSLLLLALDAFGITAPDAPGETIWVGGSILVGFFVAGYYVGTRTAAAPVLHGFAMGLFSLIAWLLVNLFLGEPAGGASWRSLEAGTLIGLLTIQAVAAIVGARIGVRWTRTPPGQT